MNTQRVEGHTPIWSVTADGLIQEGPHNTPVAHMVSPSLMAGSLIEWEAKRDLIVHAVNNIERLEKVNEALVRALKELLEEIDNLQDISYSTSIEHYKAEACWESAVESAHSALKLAKEPA